MFFLALQNYLLAGDRIKVSIREALKRSDPLVLGELMACWCESASRAGIDGHREVICL